MAPEDEHRMLRCQQDAHGRAQTSRPKLGFAQLGMRPGISANTLAHRTAAGEKLCVYARFGCHYGSPIDTTDRLFKFWSAVGSWLQAYSYI